MGKRIERKTSQTAKMTTLCRAASYFEKDNHYRSNDYLAPMFIPRFINLFLRLRFSRRLIVKRFAPRGIYEYVISRTKYIDEIFARSVKDEFDQILILGAGFDTRGIRLLPKKSRTSLFELDAPHTQNAKIAHLRNRGFETPGDINFISIDFNRDSIEKRLTHAGFQKDRRSLFILEGLIMYLDEPAVEELFNLMKDFAGKESLVVFDTIYASILREEHLFYGEKEIFETVKNADEKWIFGIEANEIQSFLAKKDYQLSEQHDSISLEQKYFSDGQGEPIAKVNGTHCIVLAKLN